MIRIASIALSCCIILQSAIISASSKQLLSDNLKGRFLLQTKLLAKNENCLKYDRSVKPSTQTKTVILQKFGLKIQIPQNFRTLLTSKGEVWILNPVDYELLACSARGGFGGRGMYYSYVRSVPNPNNLSLQSLVRKQYNANASIVPYPLSGLNGLLAESPSEAFKASSFFVKIPGITNIVEIGAGCDCDVDAKNIKNFLKSVSLR